MIENFLQKNALTQKAFEVALKNEDLSKPICLDHIALRTFKLEGLGLGSVAPFFLEQDYSQAGVLEFPDQKAALYWFRPPKGYEGLLPRVVISELDVCAISEQTKSIVKKYVDPIVPLVHEQTVKSSGTGKLLWETPSLEDYELLKSDSKIVSWIIAHGYALNHIALSVHNINSLQNGIYSLNDLFESEGIEINQHGGAVKVTNDGGLKQIASVTDQFNFVFKDGIERSIPNGFLECAERMVMKEYQHLNKSHIREIHRRDGFEDNVVRKIFATTFKPKEDCENIVEE